MTLEQDLLAAWTDHVYENVIKPRITECEKALRDAAPVRGGTLRDSVAVYLGRGSNDDTAVVVFQADPPQTAPYNTFKKNFGRNDYANFTNARGSSAGWWDNAVRQAARKFGDG